MTESIIYWVSIEEELPTNDEMKIISICDETGDSPYEYVTCGWYLSEARCWIVDNEKRYDITAWSCFPYPYENRRKR